MTGSARLWPPDGHTLYYAFRSDVPIMAARLRGDPVPTVLSLDTLFPAPQTTSWTPNAALHPDGDRFISVVSAATDGAGDGELGPQQLVVR